MKKIFLLFASIFLTLVSTPIFAQPADLGDDPELVVPIDNYVWVLAIVGLAIVFFKFKSIQKNRIQN